MFILAHVKSKRNLFYAFGVVVSTFLLTVFSTTQLGFLFKATLFNDINHEPFDGTVYPYLYAIDWVNMPDSMRDLPYSGIPAQYKVVPQNYDASELARDFDSLDFSSESDKKVRNSKITYSVPYLGTYNLDGHENEGSHPAVDIKLPVGTPILAIGNGVVIKAEDQPWGFGKHVVVMHKDFPSVSGSGTETYYSSYSHMSSYSVTPGTVVAKGQVIGASGNSGTATTPHLHFQIDNSSAPWHPYWPFTGSEATAAGLDFFSAVNAGLGRSEAAAKTVHPMAYVQKFAGSSLVVAEVETDSDLLKGEAVEVESNLIKEVETDQVIEEGLPTLEVAAPSSMVAGQDYEIKIKFKKDGVLVDSLVSSDFSFKSSVISSYVLPDQLEFVNGEASISYKPLKVGHTNLTIEVDSIEARVSNIDVRAFKDVSSSDSVAVAVGYLKDKELITGYDDFSFRPSVQVTRAEALKFLSGLTKEKSVSGDVKYSFSDVGSGVWYQSYLARAVNQGAVDGNQSVFNPANGVTITEFLKMAFKGMGVDLDPSVANSYSELINSDEWYAVYLAEALKRNIIDEGDIKDLSKPMTRREIAEIVYRFRKMIDDGVDRFEE